jgi:hypothetical protein
MDQEQRIAELERRLSEFERARATRPTISTGGRRLRRGFVVAALAMAIVVLPGVALASHVFTDVPNSHTFHDEIANLSDARITTGCTPTTYCPENTVTRGQMAGFLNRGLGRAGSSDFQGTVPIPTAATLTGTHTVKVGTVSGGTAQVKVDASISAFLESFTGCPCRAVYWIVASTGASSTNYSTQFRGLISGFDWQSISISEVFTVPTGVNVTFSIRAQMGFGTGDVTAYGTITSISAPFAATGGAPATVSAPNGPEDPLAPNPR